MRINFIKEIELTNYRIFANASIKFPPEKNKNIYLIQGENGTGKTTIIDAVRWCLFGDEYICQYDVRRLPLCNCKVLGNIRKGQRIETTVRLVADTGDGEYEVTRKSGTIIKNGKAECKGGNKVLIRSLTPKKADTALEAFNPVIIDGSFIDGERLGNIAHGLEFPACKTLAAAKAAYLGFWVIVGLRKIFDIGFPLFLDSPTCRLDLHMKDKLAQDLTESLRNTQIILLEHIGEIDNQLKSNIASTHRITYKEDLGTSIIDLVERGQ